MFSSVDFNIIKIKFKMMNDKQHINCTYNVYIEAEQDRDKEGNGDEG